RWVIVDWKTGSGSADDLQAACYVMYLGHAYGAKVEETEVGESRLLSASSHVYPVDQQRLEITGARIRSSATAMKALLRDPHQNLAVETDFPLCEDRRICKRCNYQRVCPATAGQFSSGTRV
ncbi:MAG: PD-(D/E)XK nuclease family protein, partial [Acidobacteria bacterium]|nr:PD-(D/E)XK nuclease family protein [Acidobacteriota bacterium]